VVWASDCSEFKIGDMPELSENAPKDISVQILHVRGQRVLLDSQLAALYEVPTKRLNEQVRRNIDRFPDDFILRLSNQDIAALRSQIATLGRGPGKHRKYPPIAFTEHGAIMAATVLNSARAVQMSVYVVRAFVKLRELLASNSALSKRLETLERSVAALDSDMRKQFDQVYEAILGLMGSAARKI
jgi:phage regulator Rha-like protein